MLRLIRFACLVLLRAAASLCAFIRQLLRLGVFVYADCCDCMLLCVDNVACCGRCYLLLLLMFDAVACGCRCLLLLVRVVAMVRSCSWCPVGCRCRLLLLVNVLLMFNVVAVAVWFCLLSLVLLVVARCCPWLCSVAVVRWGLFFVVVTK